MPANIADGTAILEQLKAMQIEIDQLKNQMQINHEETTNSLAALTTYVDEGLMRVRNAAVGPTDPLRGPNGYLPAPITTRDELSFATGAELDALNTYLGGVRDYPAHALVSGQRQALATYLGVIPIDESSLAMRFM